MKQLYQHNSSAWGSWTEVRLSLVVALRITLKMFGVPLSKPANFFCDNICVFKNMSIPKLTSSKKHNSMKYHVMRESVEAGIMRVTKEDTWTKLPNPHSKLVLHSRKLVLLRKLLWHYWSRCFWFCHLRQVWLVLSSFILLIMVLAMFSLASIWPYI